MMSDHEIYWDSNEMDTENFIVLGGTETAIALNNSGTWILNHDEHKYMHFLCIKDENLTNRDTFFQHNQVIQRILDTGITSWNQQVRFMKEHNNIVIIAHPCWSRLDPEMMMGIEGCFAFEVWNTASIASSSCGTDEEIWDYCLRRGKRIFAIAADDCHLYGNDSHETFGGFTMVLSENLDKKSLVDSLNKGHFYASSGPLIYDMRVEGGYLKMEFSPASAVFLKSYDKCSPVIYPKGEGLLECLEWKINENIKYVRPEIIDQFGNKAWGQPIFICDLL